MGGNAFPNTKPISSELIPSVLRSLKRKLALPVNFTFLGSTGKKPMCGDIDLAVSSTEHTFDGFSQTLAAALGNENIKPQPQFNHVYTRVAIPNTKGRKFCQVDFMIGDPNLLAFTNWAPHPSSSNYQGSHRTQLIKATAKALSTVAKRNGKIVARVGYTLNSDTGLHYGARWCPPRKDGKGYTTTMVRVTATSSDAFSQAFPELLYLGDKAWTDPDAICEQLFGCGTTASRVNSFEDVVRLIKTNPSLLAKADLIWDLYCKQLTEMDIPIPERPI